MTTSRGRTAVDEETGAGVVAFAGGVAGEAQAPPSTMSMPSAVNTPDEDGAIVEIVVWWFRMWWLGACGRVRQAWSVTTTPGSCLIRLTLLYYATDGFCDALSPEMSDLGGSITSSTRAHDD